MLGRGVSHHGICHQIRFVLILLFSLWQYVETYFAEPDTIFVFKIFYEVLGGGTRLAMPNNMRAGLIVIEAWFRGY